MDRTKRCTLTWAFVDQRRFELLTSPVRAVRSRFTANYADSQVYPSMQVRLGFRLTSTPIRNHPLTGVMLGVGPVELPDSPRCDSMMCDKR